MLQLDDVDDVDDGDDGDCGGGDGTDGDGRHVFQAEEQEPNRGQRRTG